MKTIFIITDPCYLTEKDGEWGYLLATTNHFSDIHYPHKASRGVLLHHVQHTPNGDGGLSTERLSMLEDETGESRNIPVGYLDCYGKEFDIGVDSGTLCIAEISETRARKEKFGKKYLTLVDAEAEFAAILGEF